MRKQVPLKSIYAFVAVSETGSMTAAADKINVSHSAISQAIKALESQLDTVLFTRIGRRIELNKVGRIYYQKVAPALESIMQANQELLNKDQTRLTINMVNSLTLHWWIPRVNQLHQLAPKMDIRISNKVGAFDLEREGVDIAIVHDSIEPWQDYHHERLADDELILVCSPDLLNETNHKHIPHLLACFPRINVDNARRRQDWDIWSKAYGLANPKPEHQLTFVASVQAIQAAIRGLGILVTHRHFAKDDIEQGLLIEIGDAVINPKQGVYVVYQQKLKENQHALAFLDWLRLEFSV
ncbi:LysR substrate-binding domain-containing protein [Vibrio gallicus]|uniref:LysR substrate-binding domain-containing protein n=1 Tax=Vibrio gallicus TaxID=190897 RepID=UPI0021C2DDF0|nr:LysR substrate-binding domain-containing protein [Vibrio gallicus]